MTYQNHDRRNRDFKSAPSSNSIIFGVAMAVLLATGVMVYAFFGDRGTVTAAGPVQIIDHSVRVPALPPLPAPLPSTTGQGGVR